MKAPPTILTRTPDGEAIGRTADGKLWRGREVETEASGFSQSVEQLEGGRIRVVTAYNDWIISKAEMAETIEKEIEVVEDGERVRKTVTQKTFDPSKPPYGMKKIPEVRDGEIVWTKKITPTHVIDWKEID